jgi:hypothetical protein
MSSQGHSRTYNITKATSLKSFFSMLIMQKMSSCGLSKSWNNSYWLHQSLFLRCQKGRLKVLRAIRQLKISLPRIRPNRFSECPAGRNSVRMAIRHHETSLHRHQESRISWRSEGRLWVLRAIRVIKTPLKRLHQSRIFNSQNAENDFVRPFDTLKLRFLNFAKVVF